VTLIKTNFFVGIRGSVDQHNNVKFLLKVIIDEQFITFDNSLTNTIIMYFSSLKLTKIKGVCDHIMCIRNIVTQLKAFKVTMSDSLLVQYILYILPYKYAPFKISYNTYTDKWFVTHC